jgi:hypothetical protein
MDKSLKEKIIKLRNQGCSYNKIQETLKCSKGTIAFHCNNTTKEKALKRQRQNRNKNPLKRKIESFLSIKNKSKPIDQKLLGGSIERRLCIKTWHFVRFKKNKKYGERMFNEKQLMKKIGKNPTCYLTGREINLNESRSYHLDHKIPRSKGGDNSLDNCDIACREANQAKHNLSYEKFVQLCREVVNHYEKNNKK